MPLSLDPRGSVFVVFRRRPGPSLRPEPMPDGEGIPLALRWRLTFTDSLPAPRSIELGDLVSWSELTDPDLRVYSGTARYLARFPAPAQHRPGRPVWLDLGRVAELAEVRLNGRELGVLWKPPFRIDIAPALRSGDNELEIAVTNTWRNRLIGDFGKPDAGRVTRVIPRLRKNQEWLPGGPGVALSPSGLLGPVRLLRN
jgi:hypothetical protein